MKTDPNNENDNEQKNEQAYSSDVGGVKPKPDNHAAFSAGRIPEMNSSGEDEQYLTIGPKGQDTRKSTYILIGLFCIGMLCLLYMIKKAKPEKASASLSGDKEVKIEKAIARITGVKSQISESMGEIVDKFYRFSNMQQVEVNDLAKNPFQRQTSLPAEGLMKQVDSNVDPELIRHRKLQEKASEMHLLSIMESEEGNCCMIEDKVLYEGESIEEFKVKRIMDNSVILKSEGVEVTLRMSE